MKEEITKKKFEQASEENLVRILSTDIPASKSVYAGLTRIKGISWSISNAVCRHLGISKEKKIADLTESEIEKISEFIKNPKLPEFMMNRARDLETGMNSHLTGSDLDLAKEFDIKRMKKIKSYKGVRHIFGQPVRGQRTKSHFRKNKTVGVTGKPSKGKKG